MPADTSRVKALFRCALHLPPADRTAFLAHACRGDPALRSRLDQLFAASDGAAGFLEPRSPRPAPDRPPGGPRVGPYALGRRLGEGGMGVVWAAEQDEPIRRTVAVKLVKAGMDSAGVLARFEQERQVLARMSHPNIAHVLDAGETEDGRPYFVMELVDGVPIGRYCDARGLALRERLELFISVCNAVQHAHQKGVIHRDLKPSNVLVAEVDGKPVPKVIDFGIAKAVGDAPGEASSTVVGLGVLGTVEYMAPEQAEPGRPDVDTRADVYSLGALLYELLAGRPPLSPDEVRPVPLAEALRRVREDVPPRPSARLTGGPADTRLAATLRRELDWVVMKALEKDRERRYATAAELAADVRRYLDDEPVAARPPGRGYWLRKFVRRNRWPVAAATLVALAVLGGAAAATAGWVQATRAKQATEIARADAVNQGRLAEERAEAAAKWAAEARDQAATTRDVLDHVRRNVFAAGRPAGVLGGRGRDLTLRQAIDAAVPSIVTDFANRPLVEARVRHWIGQSYLALGEPGRAVEQLRLAATLDAAHPPADPADAHFVRVNLATAYLYEGKTADAVALLAEATPAAVAALGPDHPVALAARAAQGMAFDLDGRSAEAVAELEAVTADSVRVLGDRHADTRFATALLAAAYSRAGRAADADRLIKSLSDDSNDLNTLCIAAAADQRAGRPARAVALYRRVLPACEAKFGPRHPSTLETAAALGVSCVEAGQLAEGIERLEAAGARIETELGRDHTLALVAAANLAAGYVQTGRAGRAAEILKRVAPQCREKFGPAHPDTLAATATLAAAYDKLGQSKDAVELLRKVLATAMTALGPKHPHVLGTQASLGAALTGSGRPAEAIEVLKAADTACRESLPPTHPVAVRVRLLQAKACARLGQFDEAVRLYRDVVATRTATLGPDHPDTLVATVDLAFVHIQAGRPGEAIGLLEKAVPACRAALGEKHPDALNATSALGGAYTMAGRREEGADLLERAYRGYVEVFDPRHPDALLGALNLGSAYRQTGRADRAADLLARVLPLFREVYGVNHPDTLVTESVLAISYTDVGRGTDAAKLLDHVVAVRRKDLGPDHPKTVIAESNRALALEQARADGALPALEKVLPACVSRLGPTDVSTLKVKAARARELARAGRRAEAATAAADFLRAANAAHAKDPRALATARAVAARVLLSVGEHAAAEPVLRACLAAAREVRPADRSVPGAEVLLGSALLGCGKWAEAEPLLLSGYRGLAERPDSPAGPWPSSAEASRLAADLYDAVGEPDVAQSWRAKAAGPVVEHGPPPRPVDR